MVEKGGDDVHATVKKIEDAFNNLKDASVSVADFWRIFGGLLNLGVLKLELLGPETGNWI